MKIVCVTVLQNINTHTHTHTLYLQFKNFKNKIEEVETEAQGVLTGHFLELSAAALRRIPAVTEAFIDTRKLYTDHS